MRQRSAAYSLEDPTVEQSVIERRAASGSENIGNSMHDDCVRENAKWREQAGLDSYIVRDAGGGCCKWCAALEGRYRYADAPDDVFKRHDNCTCTVTYECGRKRQDVWSKKTWEASDEELQARKEASEASKPKVYRNGELKELSDSAKPKVFTPAEAKELEQQALEKNPVTKLSPEQAKAIDEQSKPTVNTQEQAKAINDAAIERYKPHDPENVNKNEVENPEEKSIIKLGINLFDKSSSIYLDALSIEEEKGFKDVFLHGSPNSVQVLRDGKPINLSVQDFVNVLKNNGYYGEDISLCSCSTGKGYNSFEQLLSKELGVKIKAPDDDVYLIPEDGIMFVGSKYSNTGKWRVFDKGVEIID